MDSQFNGWDGTSGKESACHCRRQAMWFPSLGWEDPLYRNWQPNPVFLSGESHGQWSLEPYGPSGHKGTEMPYGLNNNNYAESYKTKETKNESFVCDFRCYYVSHKKTLHLLEFTIIPMLECFYIYLNYDSENESVSYLCNKSFKIYNPIWKPC